MLLFLGFAESSNASEAIFAHEQSGSHDTTLTFNTVQFYDVA